MILLMCHFVHVPIVCVCACARVCACVRVCESHTKSGGGVPLEPHGAIKKFMVTKRELLNNLSNIYKCKVSPGGTFSLGNFLFDERENYKV